MSKLGWHCNYFYANEAVHNKEVFNNHVHVHHPAHILWCYLAFSSGEVISIRPQNTSKSVQLFKLSSPPLLTVAKKENGVLKIDEQSKENLLKEKTI